jgi:hypothetical protein
MCSIDLFENNCNRLELNTTYYLSYNKIETIPFQFIQFKNGIKLYFKNFLKEIEYNLLLNKCMFIYEIKNEENVLMDADTQKLVNPKYKKYFINKQI